MTSCHKLDKPHTLALFSPPMCARRGMFYYERETDVAIIIQRLKFSLFSLSVTICKQRNI